MKNEFQYVKYGDAYTAFFNQKESDAEEGKRAVIRAFGQKAYDKHIKPLEDGIMAIFNEKPNKVTRLYVDTVAQSAEIRRQEQYKIEMQDYYENLHKI